MKELTSLDNNDITKDIIIIKSRKISLARIFLITLVVALIYFIVVLYVMNTLDARLAESELSEFRTAVIYFEYVYNRYPSSYEELVDLTGLTRDLDADKYLWVTDEVGKPPQLMHIKSKKSSADIATK